MNPLTKLLFVALAVVAFGSLAVFGGKSADASHGTPGTVSILKLCEDQNGNPITSGNGPFVFEVDVDIAVQSGLLGPVSTTNLNALLATLDTNLGLGLPVTIGECGDDVLVVDLGALETFLTNVTGPGICLVNLPIVGCISSLNEANLAGLLDINILIGEEGSSTIGCNLDVLDDLDAFLDTGLHCTITNVITVTAPVAPTLVIEKDCVGGTGQSFSFDINPNTTAGTDPTLACNADSSTITLVAGTAYTVTEGADPAAGWDLTGRTCTGDEFATSGARGVSFTPEAGDTIRCTFTNTFTTGGGGGTDGGLTIEDLIDIFLNLLLLNNVDIDVITDIENDLRNILVNVLNLDLSQEVTNTNLNQILSAITNAVENNTDVDVDTDIDLDNEIDNENENEVITNVLTDIVSEIRNENNNNNENENEIDFEDLIDIIINLDTGVDQATLIALLNQNRGIVLDQAGLLALLNGYLSPDEIKVVVENVVNNSNENNNVSENTNTNANENTQNQTNAQDTNVTTGDVTVSSTGGSGTAQVGGHHGHGTAGIKPPNTGSAGLAGN